MIRHPPTSPLFPNPPRFRSAQVRRRLWRILAEAHWDRLARAALRAASIHPRVLDDQAPGPAETMALAHQALASSALAQALRDRKSTRLNSSHANISYAVFCL